MPPAEATIQTAARFVAVTKQTGVDFTYRNGQEAGRFSILETLGGGVALLDYDGDGDQDLALPGGGHFPSDREIQGRPPGFYRNDSDWRWTDVSEHTRLTGPYYSHAAVVGDWDNDGFPDLVMTGYGGLLLFRNMGDGTFTESTATAGLDDPLWSTAAAWGDVNGDGHLDLYVVHYVDWSFENDPECRAANGSDREVCSPRRFQGLPDRLYLSNGDGTFRNASQEAGLREDGKGLGVLIGDVDLDNDLDIYVANDTTPNFLYANDGEAHFQEIGLFSATALDNRAIANGSMGVDLGDFNRDGLPDLWVANFEDESFALYRNEGENLFTHVSRTSGVTDVGGLFVGWGTGFFDFDHDGDEDLISSNGHVLRFPQNAPVRQPPLLFENQGDGGFKNVARQAGAYLASSHAGRGLAIGDLDNDGDLDVVVSHMNEPVTLLANESAHRNHWLGVRLIGTRSPRDAVGTIVRIRTKTGKQVRQVTSGASYLSTHDRRLLFGLAAEHTVDQIEIVWPSGTRQVVRDVSADKVLTIHEPDRDD